MGDWIISSEAIVALLKIIAIDIILSGDNAIVIAMATRRLPEKQRNRAILFGTAGAVILRVLFAAVIVLLLQIPFVHLAGGLLLLWIAYKVLINEEEEANVQAADRLWKAVWTIIVADAIMSLDNVVAIAGASGGHIGMIAFGVAISIPIMIFGSKAIVLAMEKYKWIPYVGSGILAWTAGEMLLKDEQLQKWIAVSHGSQSLVFLIVVTALILLAGYVKNKKIDKRKIA